MSRPQAGYFIQVGGNDIGQIYQMTVPRPVSCSRGTCRYNRSALRRDPCVSHPNFHVYVHIGLINDLLGRRHRGAVSLFTGDTEDFGMIDLCPTWAEMVSTSPTLRNISGIPGIPSRQQQNIGGAYGLQSLCTLHR